MIYDHEGQRYVFVDQYFEMDPNTEDLLLDADKLEEGMIVLVESPELKADLNRLDSPGMFERARRWNRFMMVTELDIDAENDDVYFIAMYEDGTKKKIVTSAANAWYVRKDSMPLANAIVDELYGPVWDLLREREEEIKVLKSNQCLMYSNLDGYAVPDGANALIGTRWAWVTFIPEQLLAQTDLPVGWVQLASEGKLP